MRDQLEQEYAAAWGQVEVSQAQGFAEEAHAIVARAGEELDSLFADPFSGLSWRLQRINEARQFIESAKYDAAHFANATMPF